MSKLTISVIKISYMVTLEGELENGDKWFQGGFRTLTNLPPEIFNPVVEWLAKYELDNQGLTKEGIEVHYA